MWFCPTLGTYITIETSGRVDICPSEDIKPHLLHQGNCPCAPQVQMHHNKMHVLHIRYAETQAITTSMQKLFGIPTQPAQK